MILLDVIVCHSDLNSICLPTRQLIDNWSPMNAMVASTTVMLLLRFLRNDKGRLSSPVSFVKLQAILLT